jgi:hypothetical protein
MAMAARSTRFLTEARVELVPSSQRGLALLLGGAGLAAAAVMGLMQFGGAAAPFSRVGALERENEALRAEVAKLGVEIEVERATRTALDQQVADLNGQVVELTSQVEFYRAKGAPRRAAAPRD